MEDILHERGIDICHETVWFWVERFGSKFAGEIRKKRTGQHSNWQWHLDEVFVKINGERVTFGAPLITKAKFLNALLQNDATRLKRRSFSSDKNNAKTRITQDHHDRHAGILWRDFW